MSDWILNPEWEHAQFVSISELRECERKLEVLNRGNANAERILCELTGCESGRDVPDWIVAAKERIAHLESWINSLDEVLRYNGKDGQREWCGSEVGYLYQGQRVYVGGDKP